MGVDKEAVGLSKVHLRGVVGRDSREFLFLVNFELLTFPCREMIKLSIHILYDMFPK